MSRKIKEIKQLTETGYVSTPIGCDAENVDLTDGKTLEEYAASVDAHIENDTDHITSSERAAWNRKLDADGDSKNNTVTFTSNDNTSPTAWTDVDALTSGEKHNAIFSKISTMFKNIRWLYKMFGTTDISSMGNGTVTGALSQLNTDLPYMFSNPNLFINPDFKINQRGQEVYNGLPFTYTIDRWTIYNSDTTVAKTSAGVSCAPYNSSYSTFGQRIEHLQKGQYTVSFSATNLTNDIYLSVLTNDKQYFLESFNTAGLHSTTFTIDTDIDNLLVYFFVHGGDFSLQWVKLELGSIATPFIPPDPATELLKCQRYYWSNMSKNVDHAIGSLLASSMESAHYRPMGFCFPVAMRKVPTVTIGACAYVDASAINISEDIIASRMTNISIGCLYSPSASFTRDVDCYVKLEADAEIY